MSEFNVNNYFKARDAGVTTENPSMSSGLITKTEDKQKDISRKKELKLQALQALRQKTDQAREQFFGEIGRAHV